MLDLDCLVLKGILTQEQVDALEPLYSQMSGASALELLRVSAIMGINNNSAPTIISSALVTSAGPVTGITVPSGATKAMITVHTNDINFRVDGANPNTTTTGHRAIALSSLEITNPSGFKFIPITGSASVYVTFFK